MVSVLFQGVLEDALRNHIFLKFILWICLFLFLILSISLNCPFFVEYKLFSSFSITLFWPLVYLHRQFQKLIHFFTPVEYSLIHIGFFKRISFLYHFKFFSTYPPPTDFVMGWVFVIVISFFKGAKVLPILPTFSQTKIVSCFLVF